MGCALAELETPNENVDAVDEAAPPPKPPKPVLLVAPPNPVLLLAETGLSILRISKNSFCDKFLNMENFNRRYIADL